MQDLRNQNPDVKSFEESLRNLREQGQRDIRNLQSNTPLPEVESVSVDPLSPERLDFAERLANRPVI